MKKESGRVGEKNNANNGLVMEIIEYRNKDDIDVKFEDGTVVCNKKYSDFIVGKIGHPTLKNYRGSNKGGCKTGISGTLFNIDIKNIAYQQKLSSDNDLITSFYHYECPKCGYSYVAPVDEIKGHKC